MRQSRRHVFLVMYNWAGYLSGVQLGIADYLAQRPEWVWTRVLPKPDQFALMERSHADGVIAYVEQAYLARLKNLAVPVVDVSDWLPAGAFPRVVPDNNAVGRLAAQHLMDLGLKHFAVVGQENAAFSEARSSSFARTLAEAGLTADVFGQRRCKLPKGTAPSPGINVAMAAWLLQLPRPVGIFGTSDNIAADVLKSCRHLEIRVPEDICVIGADNDELTTRFTHPPLSSIALPTQRIGFEAARLLDALMDGQPPPTRPILLPPIGVVARQSTNPLMIPDDDVQAAVQYIREHVHQQVSVRDVLRAVPVNRRSLERKFKNLLGRSPLQEIRRVRIEKAKVLLGTTDLPMSAIARHSGFANAWRLARIFRAAMQTTPSGYRKTLRLNAR